MTCLEITKDIKNTKNFNMKYTWTECTAGGTMLHIADHLPYKTRLHLDIDKTSELESVFIEPMTQK